ncbi:MAG: hypothetical protein ACOX0P_01060 [Candidatus Dojkabacteria bacterium]|jgi:hypothetical protein
MNIKIKNSTDFVIKKENQDYTFIFDSDSNLPIFISNSLLAELGGKSLSEKQNEIFLQIIETPDNGIYSKDNIENGIFIRVEEEFNKIFDCN